MSVEAVWVLHAYSENSQARVELCQPLLYMVTAACSDTFLRVSANSGKGVYQLAQCVLDIGLTAEG